MHNPAPKNGTQRRVLVLEDEETIRTIIVRTLRDRGYEVHEAGTTDDALAVLKTSNAINVLVSDVTLPGGTSGPELYAQARERQPDMKVIFISGYIGADEVAENMEPAPAPVLHKPFLAEELAAVVEKVLED